MEIPFPMVLRHYSGFFQEEVGDLSTIRFSSSAELYFKVFSLRYEINISCSELKACALTLLHIMSDDIQYHCRKGNEQ